MTAPKVAVAYSGGRDSTALLHATCVAAREFALQVLALHVHHGLNPGADDWLRHGRGTCRRWAARGLPVDFVAERLATAPAAGESVEAWARRERYRALGAMARTHGATTVLLAHHRRDQAETLLLQALRGGGVAGLAAMPQAIERDGIQWLRPWLGQPAEAIDAYVRRHRLRHIDDDSNADPRYARNRLRLEVWPALVAAFPQAEAGLARAATWTQQAHAALGELADIDLLRVCDERGLALGAWRELSSARRSNALRAWLMRECASAAPAALVERLMEEVDRPGAARWACGAMELRRYRGWLVAVRPAQPSTEVPPRAVSLAIHSPGRYAVPGWAGELSVEAVVEGGVALDRLARLHARPRDAAVRFQAGPGRPPRSLKRQYQMLGVAAWDRNGPLLYDDAGLIFVPGLGIDARALAAPGEPQVRLCWLSTDSAGRAVGDG